MHLSGLCDPGPPCRKFIREDGPPFHSSLLSLLYTSPCLHAPPPCSKFVSEHGGHTNAYTSNESTNYHFDVNWDCLEPALDRWVLAAGLALGASSIAHHVLLCAACSVHWGGLEPALDRCVFEHSVRSGPPPAQCVRHHLCL